MKSQSNRFNIPRNVRRLTAITPNILLADDVNTTLRGVYDVPYTGLHHICRRGVRFTYLRRYAGFSRVVARLRTSFQRFTFAFESGGVSRSRHADRRAGYDGRPSARRRARRDFSCRFRLRQRKRRAREEVVVTRVRCETKRIRTCTRRFRLGGVNGVEREIVFLSAPERV